ncbi:MAG: type IV pilus modification protein PilV [Shewanella sp.]
MASSVKGFSLIEVLVALVILVVGLVGIFNLHIVAKRGSFESYQQTQASYYANDMINRMRLNASQLANYDNDSPFSGLPTAAGKDCNTEICAPNDMLAWDIYEWQSAFTGTAEIIGSKNLGGLDAPTACINVNGNDVLVVLVWRGIRETKIDTSNINDIASKCAADTKNRRIFSMKTVII